MAVNLEVAAPNCFMFTNTLPGNAQKALAILGKHPQPPGVYLAGGSALALHLGHRISVDFDFFTPKHFKADKIAQEMASIGSFKLETLDKDTLLGTFEKVKYSLFYYKYPLIAKTINFNGINLADSKDIAAMKIAAVSDRGTKKDFVDLYILSEKGTSLEDCFKYYDQKYKALANNIYTIIKCLTYFEDAKNTPMPRMLINLEWRTVQKFFEKETLRLAKKFLS